MAQPNVSTTVADDRDELVPDPQVWREFGISSMTGWRWTHDPDLKFPPAIKIRGRCYRSRRLIEEFKARLLRVAIEQRSAKAVEVAI
jgi:predicted DNA-binding transcriptional regulator AlpA